MLVYVILACFFLWLVLVTVILAKTRGHYQSLTQRTKHRKIDDILDSIVQLDENNSRDIVALKKRVEEVSLNAERHYQKMGLVRFNPFGRTEGDKSFVLSLLDGQNNGIVMNFIYTHEGLRIYSKKVKEGQGEEHALSGEEKAAVEKSL